MKGGGEVGGEEGNDIYTKDFIIAFYEQLIKAIIPLVLFDVRWKLKASL